MNKSALINYGRNHLCGVFRGDIESEISCSEFPYYGEITLTTNSAEILVSIGEFCVYDVDYIKFNTGETLVGSQLRDGMYATVFDSLRDLGYPVFEDEITWRIEQKMK